MQYLRTMSDGMAGMVHARDVQVAAGMIGSGLELPSDFKGAGPSGTTS
jgi:hypothetical protein